MPASALCETEEPRPDDADVRRREGEIPVEADLEHEAVEVLAAHIGHEGEEGVDDVEGVEFEDPLVGVGDLLGVEVPAEIAEGGGILEFLERGELFHEATGGG